jgi:hypothetical protein
MPSRAQDFRPEFHLARRRREATGHAVCIDLFVLACVLSRVNSAVEEQGDKGAARELEILGVFSSRARRRMRSNINRIDDNDDDLVKALADHIFEADGYSWDTL